MIYEAVNVTICKDGKEEHRKAVLIVNSKEEMIEQLDRYLSMVVSCKNSGVTGIFAEGFDDNGDEIEATVSTRTIAVTEASDLVKDERVTVLSAV